MDNKTKILFDGYYGYKNSGDDAFVEVASWGARNIWKKNKVRFLGGDIPKTNVLSKGYPIKLAKTYKYQSQFLIHYCDYFISAGGSTFHDINEHTKKFFANHFKKKTNAPKLGAIGVSIGPFKNDNAEKSVVEYLKNLDFLCLRDTLSYKYASSLNLPYEPIEAFDLAALLPLVYNGIYLKKNGKGEKQIIGISVCNYESYIGKGNLDNENRRNRYIEELLRILDKSGDYIFHFFIFNDHSTRGDSKLTHRMINRIAPKNYKIIPYSRCTEKTWLGIARCDLMISTRLHAGIFACFSNTPFFMVEYHRKCADFLNDIGQKEEYRIYDAEKELKQISDSILSVLEDDEYSPPKHREETANRAMLNFNKVDINGKF